jgi:hypothetical protein
VKLKVRGSQLQPGDVLFNGKVVSFRMPLDASQTPGLMTKLNCREFSAIGFVGEALPILLTDQVQFRVERNN